MPSEIKHFLCDFRLQNTCSSKWVHSILPTTCVCISKGSTHRHKISLWLLFNRAVDRFSWSDSILQLEVTYFYNFRQLKPLNFSFKFSFTKLNAKCCLKNGICLDGDPPIMKSCLKPQPNELIKRFKILLLLWPDLPVLPSVWARQRTPASN